MEIDIRHLRLIETVAKEGNLTRAGERLHLTQSALSHQLLDLEEELGVRLFNRVKRSMVITAAGERLLRSAEKIRHELDQATAELRRIARGDGGVLRISTECYTTYHWLPPLLVAFQKEFTAVDIRI